MTVNVYNTTINEEGYIHSFEIPNYSQFKRIRDRLIKYVEYQGQKDLNNRRMRFYVFVVNTSNGQSCWRESDLSL